MTDYNTQVIEEFRVNNGELGGNFAGAPMLILHSTGAKSGEERLHPMMYQAVGDSWAVFASYAGRDNNPAWYHNLITHPQAKIEVGTETVDVIAREVKGEEREPIWTEQKKVFPGFAEYEAKTTRVIPVIVLDRA